MREKLVDIHASAWYDLAMNNTTIKKNGTEIDVVDYDSFLQLTTTLRSGRKISLDVFRPRTMFGQPASCGVNWPGIGTVDADDAEDFANLVAAAATLARDLDIDAERD
jgi:hypothetical protein